MKFRKGVKKILISKLIIIQFKVKLNLIFKIMNCLKLSEMYSILKNQKYIIVRFFSNLSLQD
jgi:hypothetical protein